MAGKVGALFVGLGLDDAQYRAGMAAAVGTSQKSTALMQTNFSTLNFRTFLYGMAGVYAVKRAIEGIMAPSVQFESQMAAVSTVLGKSAATMMPAFIGQLKNMAKETGQSTGALSNALRDIVGSVIAPTEAMGLLKIANESAIGGMTDTATTTSALVTILKSYGMETSRAAHVSDVLFATVLRGRITFEELASGIGVVASSAAQAGMKFEEVGAMISVMTRAGLSPDMAMIALANLLNKFVASSKEAKITAHNLGFELNTTTLKAGGMGQVMRALTKATSEQIAVMFPEMRGIRGINAALSDAAGFMQDLEAMTHAAGMRMDAFAIQFNTTREILKRFGQVLLQDVVLPFTDALIPAVRGGIAGLTTWIQANRELVKIKLTNWAIGFKDAVVGVLKLAEALKYLLGVWAGSIVVSIMTSKITAFGVTVTKVIASVYSFTAALLGLAAAQTAVGVASTLSSLKNYRGGAKNMQRWLGTDVIAQEATIVAMEARRIAAVRKVGAPRAIDTGRVAGSWATEAAVGAGIAGSMKGGWLARLGAEVAAIKLGLAGIAGSPGLVGLTTLAVGGYIYAGAKGIKEHLKEIDGLKFEKISQLGDTLTFAAKKAEEAKRTWREVFDFWGHGARIAEPVLPPLSTKTILARAEAQKDAALAAEWHANNLKILGIEIAKQVKAGKSWTEIWKDFAKTATDMDVQATYGVALKPEGTNSIRAKMRDFYNTAKDTIATLPPLFVDVELLSKAKDELDKISGRIEGTRIKMQYVGIEQELAEEELRFKQHVKTIEKDYGELGKTNTTYQALQTASLKENSTNRRAILIAYNKEQIKNEVDTVEKFTAETLQLTRDTQFEKADLIQDDTKRALEIMNLNKKFYMEDLDVKYKGTQAYLDRVKALNTYYAGIEANIQAEAAARSIQAWEAFKDHFSSILGRMVNEGELSAKAIGQAFADAFRRIAIERAAEFVVEKGFDWASTLPIIGGILGFLAAGPAGIAPGASAGATAGGFVGGLVGKPAYALPQGGVRGVSNTDNSDNSSVNIHIHASSDDLRTMNPYKFAQLYKEAKRSQLLAG